MRLFLEVAGTARVTKVRADNKVSWFGGSSALATFMGQDESREIEEQASAIEGGGAQDSRSQVHCLITRGNTDVLATGQLDQRNSRVLTQRPLQWGTGHGIPRGKKDVTKGMQRRRAEGYFNRKIIILCSVFRPVTILRPSY